MKLKDFLSAQAVIDAWMEAVEVEFGLGWHTATLNRLSGTVAGLIDHPSQLAPAVIEFGYQNGNANHSLDFTMRCLELLTEVADLALADRLDTRNVAVLVAEGWNSGMLGRLHPTNELLTPMPVFLHLLKQRYVSAEAQTDRLGRRIVLIVVDLRDVTTTRMEFERLRATAINTLRSVWSSAHPISEGVNGNLVVMVDRDEALHAMVGKVRRMVLADGSLHSHRVHVWIEPLSDAGFHLESHLESLVGPIEAPPQLVARAV